jgi:hypothetical protein
VINQIVKKKLKVIYNNIKDLLNGDHKKENKYGDVITVININ